MERRIIGLFLSLAFLLVFLGNGVLADEATPAEANKQISETELSEVAKKGENVAETSAGGTTQQDGMTQSGSDTATGDTSGTDQSGTSDTTTGGTSGSDLQGTGDTTTGDMSGTDQSGTSGTTAGGTSGTDQSETRGTISGDTSGTNQSGTSGTASGDTSGTDQSGTSGTTSGDTSGTDQPGTSGSTSGTDQSGTSDTTSGDTSGTDRSGSSNLTTDGAKGAVLSGDISTATGDNANAQPTKESSTDQSDGSILPENTEQLQLKSALGSDKLELSTPMLLGSGEKGVSVTSKKQIQVDAVGGINKLTAKVLDASPEEIRVTINSGTVSRTESITGVGSVSFVDITDGTYSVKFKYVDDTREVEIKGVRVINEAGEIKDLQIVPGEEKIKISGKAESSSQILLIGYSKYDSSISFAEFITSGSEGNFTVTIPCAAGIYNVVEAKYLDIDYGCKKEGTWEVTSSSVKPDLIVDTIYDSSLTVTAMTKAGLKVIMETPDRVVEETADSSGFVKFSLLHTYSAGTNIKFYLTYGSELYIVTRTVESSSTYKELKYGSSGIEVLNLTRRLAELRYPLKETNYFDSEVENAVKLFQSKNGLSVTGVADSLTQMIAYSSAAVPYDSHVYPTLVRGDRGPLVTNLQSRLKTLGYYTIKVDGIFGSGTERAVRNFQSRNGLYPTGVADSTMQQVLYSSGAIPAGSSCPSYYTTLRRSNRYNSAVVSLQNRLNSLGYNAGAADGYFGSRTYRAVRNFQSRNGLPVTGVADVTMQQVLYSSSAIPALYGSGTSSSTTSTGYRLLYWGCTGDSVRRLQQALRNLGYTQIKSVDGIYGQQTYDAVCAFQRNNGLSVDGIAGKKTQNLLYGTLY